MSVFRSFNDVDSALHFKTNALATLPARGNLLTQRDSRIQRGFRASLRTKYPNSGSIEGEGCQAKQVSGTTSIREMKNSAGCLAMDAKEVAVVSRYRIPAEAVERAAEQEEEAP